MKKSLLFAACAATVVSMSAQTNFVKNGDFESANFEQNNPWDWDDSKHNLQSLEGWEIDGLNDWCVLAMIAETEIDDEYTFEGNKQCLHIYRFDDNGWDKGSLYQNVIGLEPGETYTLGAIMARNMGETVSWDDHYFEVAVKPLGADGEELPLENLFADRDEALSEGEFWCEYTHEFKAPESGCIRITFTHMNNKWSGNHSTGFWLDVDDVCVMTPDDYQEYFANKGVEDRVEALNAERNAQVTGVYDFAGVRVADSMDQLNGRKGMFIVTTTAGAKKIVK